MSREYFCKNCRRTVRRWNGIHTCERLARSDDDTHPITTGELAGPADPGQLAGGRSREESS